MKQAKHKDFVKVIKIVLTMLFAIAIVGLGLYRLYLRIEQRTVTSETEELVKKTAENVYELTKEYASMLEYIYASTPTDISQAIEITTSAKLRVRDSRETVEKMRQSAERGRSSLEEDVEIIAEQYDELFNIAEKLNERFELFFEFKRLEAEISLKMDEFEELNDIANLDVDEEKYSNAVTTFKRAIDKNEEILALREKQYLLNDQMNMDLIDQIKREEELYKEFSLLALKEYEELAKNPQIPPAKRFEESGKVYRKFIEVSVTDSEYDELVASWIAQNIDPLIDEYNSKLSEID